MRMWFFGQTASGQHIPAYTFGPDSAKTQILIMGGVHGDEPEGIHAAFGLLHEFTKSYPFALKVHLVPALNMEGAFEHQRTNANGVDLNRNLPTKDWTAEVAKPRYNPGPSALSESENKALVKFLQDNPMQYILSLHSWNPMLNINGDCRKLAEVIAERVGYIITEDIGYPTPGSLGTYAGHERGIPTITYELERGMKCRDILEKHVPAIIEGIKWIEANQK